MKLFILPYNGGSRGCAELANELGVRRIKLKGSKFKPGLAKCVLNWGNSKADLPQLLGQQVWINHPSAVDAAANKRLSLDMLHEAGVAAVESTDDRWEAAAWAAAGYTVMARTLLRGNSGKGIVILNEDGESMDVDDAHRAVCSSNGKLFTKYFKARDEYRVHVMAGKVLDVQQKKKRNDAEDVNFKVRNHDGGFVFCREGVEAPDIVLDTSIAAVAALGLDFGAVDIRYNDTANKAAVLEVNTAPGLEGTTLEKYSEAIRELFMDSAV